MISKNRSEATDGTRLVQFGMISERSRAAYSMYVSSDAQLSAQNVQARVISTNSNKIS